jgi:hypothetical protein
MEMRSGVWVPVKGSRRARPHARRLFRLGEIYRISDGSGIDSNKLAMVVPPFDWHDAPGLYKPPDLKREVPIRIANGPRTYMFKDRLWPVEG